MPEFPLSDDRVVSTIEGDMPKVDDAEKECQTDALPLPNDTFPDLKKSMVAAQATDDFSVALSGEQEIFLNP